MSGNDRRATPQDPAYAPGIVNAYKPTVDPDWTDYNGHFNVAYYTLTFDRAAAAYAGELGLNEDALASLAVGLSAASVDTDYRREVHVGRPLSFTTQTLSVGEAAIHVLQAMYEAEAGYLAAVEERTIQLRSTHDGAIVPLPPTVRSAADLRRRNETELPLPEGRPRLLGPAV